MIGLASLWTEGSSALGLPRKLLPATASTWCALLADRHARTIQLAVASMRRFIQSVPTHAKVMHICLLNLRHSTIFDLAQRRGSGFRSESSNCPLERHPSQSLVTFHPPRRLCPSGIILRPGCIQVFTITVPPHSAQLQAADVLVMSMSPSARQTYALGGTQKYELPISEVSLSTVGPHEEGGPVACCREDSVFIELPWSRDGEKHPCSGIVISDAPLRHSLLAVQNARTHCRLLQALLSGAPPSCTGQEWFTNSLSMPRPKCVLCTGVHYNGTSSTTLISPDPGLGRR